MLGYTKRYIHVCAFLLAFTILFIFIILDIEQFYEQYQQHYQENLENSIVTQNLYAEISKRVQDNMSKEDEEKVEMKEIDEIDIYSTNPWRIKIPKLRLDAPIAEGTSQEALRRTVGHFEQTDEWKGNVCLAGHNCGYRCNFFQEIKTLEKGDIIIYCTKKGEREYQVVVNTVIKETDWSYLKNTKDNRITLITCEMNRREYRRCIQAVEIKNV